MSTYTLRMASPVLLMAITAAAASGETLHVPADYSTIQDAIDASVDGDEIIVVPGTYKEAINFNGKAVHLHSSDGAEATIIDATGLYASVVTCSSGEDSDTVIEGFTITGGFGGMNNDASDPTVINCTFRGNKAYNFGGGMNNYRSSPIVIDCMFIGNSVPFGDQSHEGGGMYNLRSSPTITGCTFVGNTASLGGGIYNAFSSPMISNCTFSGNDLGAIWLVDDNVVTVSNCIFWGDSHEFYEFYIEGGNAVVRFCDVAGGEAAVYVCDDCELVWGQGNFDADPLFTRNPTDGGDGWGDNPDTPDFDEGSNDDFGDLRLQSNSPCIDAGDPAYDPPPGATDLDGLFRVWDGNADDTAVVDMGAYEFGSHAYGDLNCDAGVDFNDIDAFVAALAGREEYEQTYAGCDYLLADVNSDGAVDFGDIDAFVVCLINGGCP